MGDEDNATEPNLELPRLFGRKKSRSPATSPDALPPVDAPEAGSRPVGPSNVEPSNVEPSADESSADQTQVIEQTALQTVPPAGQKRPPFVDEAPTKASAPLKPVKEPRTPRAPRAPAEDREPFVTGRMAAALTGLVVGAAMVGATAGSLRACEAVQGTASCGSAGFPILLAIVVAAVMIGSALLRTFRVPDPGSTSFLAVGCLAVISLLVFIDVLDRWWMVIVIPLIGVATYLLAHWVTTTFIEPADD